MMFKRKPKKLDLGKSYRRTLITIILLVVVHYGLLRWMDGSNAFGVLTASGKNTPLLTTLAAMTMIGLRMYLYLIVPGMAAARLGNATLCWYADRRMANQTSGEGSCSIESGADKAVTTAKPVTSERSTVEQVTV